MSGLRSPWTRTLLAVLLLAALLPLPVRPGAYTLGHFIPPHTDLAATVLVLCLIPRGTAVPIAALGTALAALTLWRLADLGMVAALGREFNPVLDRHLLVSAWELASGTFGAAAAALLLVLFCAAFAGLAALLHWAIGGPSRLPGRARAGLAALALLSLAALDGPRLPGEVAARAERLRTALSDERRFQADLSRDAVGRPDFAALRGRDVIFLFVESYGRAWIEGAPYAATAARRLDAAETRLRQAGFAMRSGWFDAPTTGGQSWLAHGAVMSGLWTSSQARYDAVLASRRRSLNRLFAEAGWQSVTVVPAITRAWPEAEWFGYDAILDRDALGYRGQPFDWVTMPDQYTLSALDRLTRAGAAPVMVEAALISSHAPWTPLPEIVAWDRVGDGAIFDGTRRRGATPREVWSSPDRIRAAYSDALDHTIEVVAQWIARSGGDALVVVLGDHQPAPLVAGEGAGIAVPLHVIARDAALLDRLPGPWSEGMVPAATLPERSLAEIRALFAACFSTGGCPAGAG